MPRKRLDSNKDLPHNVYAAGHYFYWIHPKSGKRVPLPHADGIERMDTSGMEPATIRAIAIAQGRELNTALALQGEDPVRRGIGKRVTIGEAIDECRSTLLAKYKAGRNRYNAGHYLDRLKRDVGHLPVTCDIKPLHEAMSQYSDNAYIRQRMHLERVFAYCYRAGHLPLTHTNPATVLEKRTSEAPKRERLSLNEYRAIYAEAPDYLKTAMALMLCTTLRPGDIVNLQFSQYREGALLVKLEKTGKALAIRLSEAERAIVDAARQSGVVSPYIVHRLPQRHGIARKGKHPTQLTVAYLSTAFKRIRDRLGIGGENPPTLYEIRSLGGRLYREQGRSDGEIQRLYGHTDSGMTLHYLEDRMDIFDEVFAGLEV